MCDIATAATIGGGALGAIAGGGSKKTSQTSASSPWAPQGAQLENAYGQAQGLYNQTVARPAWEATNPTTAGVNGTQYEAAATGADFGRTTGSALAGGVGSQAGALVGSGQSFAANAGALAQGGAGTANPLATGVLSQAASGVPLGSSGVAGSTGLSGQTTALGTAQQLTAQGRTDLNPSIQASAAGYMNSGLINGQVDAATRDVARTLGEETIPGLNARAMAGGNVNSARAGAAESVARRGAEDRAADISTDIRGRAYDTGITAALAANGQQNSLALGANGQAIGAAGSLSSLGEGQRQFDTTTQVGAAQSLGALDVSNRSLDAQTRLSANGQLGTATSLGFQGAELAGSLADANAARIGAQGNLQQAEAQRQLDEQRTQYYAEEERRKAALGDYYGIVGAGNFGKTTTGTAYEPGAGVLGGALGGASSAYGLYQSLNAPTATKRGALFPQTGGTVEGGTLSLSKLF